MDSNPWPWDDKASVLPLCHCQWSIQRLYYYFRLPVAEGLLKLLTLGWRGKCFTTVPLHHFYHLFSWHRRWLLDSNPRPWANVASVLPPQANLAPSLKVVRLLYFNWNLQKEFLNCVYWLTNPGNSYWRERISTVELLVLTSLDQLLLIFKICLFYLTKQGMRRSMVLSLPLQQGFPDLSQAPIHLFNFCQNPLKLGMKYPEWLSNTSQLTNGPSKLECLSHSTFPSQSNATL